MLLRQINARQLTEWAAYYAIEPFGDERADLRSAIVAAVINNRWRGKNEPPKEPKDFMPYLNTDQTSDEIKMTLKQILGK